MLTATDALDRLFSPNPLLLTVGDIWHRGGAPHTAVETGVHEGGHGDRSGGLTPGPPKT